MQSLVDIRFNSSLRPRAKLAQIGQFGGTGFGGLTKPPYKKLWEYQQLAAFDPTISYCLFVLIDTVIASLGEICHPDPEIQKYLRYNISFLGGIRNNKIKPGNNTKKQDSKLYQGLYAHIYTTLWSGFSVTEKLFAVNNGTLLLEDLATYHPSSILIRPNKQGRLIEGQQSKDLRKTGIYQNTDTGEKILPLWKVAYSGRNVMYGNYYGNSILEGVYKWTVFKEALIEMLANALDRHGNPIVALTVPIYPTGETEVDPDSGEEINLTTQDVIERQLESQNLSGGGNVIILPQVDPELTPKAQVLTTGNDVGSSFERSFNLADREIAKGLFVPYGLVSNDPNSEGSMTQRQMELFNRITQSFYASFIPSFVSQVFHHLVLESFNRESAKIAPTLELKNIARPEDRVALMQVIKGLTEDAYLNPENKSDWSEIRNMLDFNDRPMDEKDVEFVKNMLINPRQKSGSNSDPSSRPRSLDGAIQGQGTGAGRPTGNSSARNT